MDNIFTYSIKNILQRHIGKDADDIFEKSQLIQYINMKTRSANRGSKSRSSFANIYAIYVLIEDYILNGYDKNNKYSQYEGALFNKLLSRQRELPFGSKLQNHALNNRVNSEFQKYFPNSEFIPIIRNLETNRYWINENLLKVKIDRKDINISKVIIEIIDEYIKVKQESFQRFVEYCEELQVVKKTDSKKAAKFIVSLL